MCNNNFYICTYSRVNLDIVIGTYVFWVLVECLKLFSSPFITSSHYVSFKSDLSFYNSVNRDSHQYDVCTST